MTRKPVTRLGRKLDIVSIVLVLFGAGLFIVAFMGMAELRDMREDAAPANMQEAYAALNRYYRLQRLSWMGIGTAIVGIGVGLSAAWHNRRFGKTGTADPSLRSG